MPRDADWWQQFILNGRHHSYFGDAKAGLPLSLKCVFNGTARYTIGRAEFAVDDGGYLILNDRQPYTIEVASPTLVETFILWFPSGWAEEVERSLRGTTERLLDDPCNTTSAPHFFERYTPHGSGVSPRMREIRAAFKASVPIDRVWLEEKMRELLAAMLRTQHSLPREFAKLPAARPATRQELWRRVQRAKDFLHARAATSVTLSDAARVACLSPFHFLRVFRAAFGCTPHEFLTECRIARAKFLLRQSSLPVTEVCFEAGFSSLGSFSTLFSRMTGQSPRAWRQQHGATTQVRNYREVMLRAAQ